MALVAISLPHNPPKTWLGYRIFYSPLLLVKVKQNPFGFFHSTGLWLLSSNVWGKAQQRQEKQTRGQLRPSQKQSQDPTHQASTALPCYGKGKVALGPKPKFRSTSTLPTVMSSGLFPPQLEPNSSYQSCPSQRLLSPTDSALVSIFSCHIHWREWSRVRGLPFFVGREASDPASRRITNS